MNPDGCGLNAEGSMIDGDVDLSDRFVGNGEIRLGGAHIHCDLYCMSKSVFCNRTGRSLSAHGTSVR